jgi:hypothetical protein
VVRGDEPASPWPWSPKPKHDAVLQCEKCSACFALPETGLPEWVEAPQERERNLRLANLRARWTVVTQEAGRWRKRSELATRANEIGMMEEARKMAARYEGEGHLLRAEIERLGGELPKASSPDASEPKVDDELAAMREKVAAKRAEQTEATAQGSSKTDEASSESLKGDEDDELAALKRKMSDKEPAKQPPVVEVPKEEDELAALKRKLKKNLVPSAL